MPLQGRLAMVNIIAAVIATDQKYESILLTVIVNFEIESHSTDMGGVHQKDRCGASHINQTSRSFEGVVSVTFVLLDTKFQPPKHHILPFDP
jgi:hypothetical protein